MAAGHAMRGMVTAWLGLVVLQTVSTQGGSGRLASLFGDVDRLLQRAFDPNIPAIPDRRTAAGSSPAGGTGLFSNALHNVATVAGGAAQPKPTGTGGNNFAI
jgi:hypothetical protein